jgi:colicin import membrane protein
MSIRRPLFIDTPESSDFELPNIFEMSKVEELKLKQQRMAEARRRQEADEEELARQLREAEIAERREKERAEAERKREAVRKLAEKKKLKAEAEAEEKEREKEEQERLKEKREGKVSGIAVVETVTKISCQRKADVGSEDDAEVSSPKVSVPISETGNCADFSTETKDC